MNATRIIPRINALSCVWMETGNPRQPLACVWLEDEIAFNDQGCSNSVDHSAGLSDFDDPDVLDITCWI
jgi:hypothetical protein